MATMAEQIDELRGMIADLTDRVTGIEQRQAKLAIDDAPPADDEQAEWDELAKMLGMESVAWMVGYMSQNRTHGFQTDEQCERNFKAMLVGLAEGECNGSIWLRRDALKRNGENWQWSAGDADYVCGSSNSRPAAAIAMLRAYRECDDAE